MHTGIIADETGGGIMVAGIYSETTAASPRTVVTKVFQYVRTVCAGEILRAISAFQSGRLVAFKNLLGTH